MIQAEKKLIDRVKETRIQTWSVDDRELIRAQKDGRYYVTPSTIDRDDLLRLGLACIAAYNQSREADEIPLAVVDGF